MKKKIVITLIVIVGIFVAFLFGKPLIKKAISPKPTLSLTVYTLSSSDTQKWNKVKQLETNEAIYPIRVEEVPSVEKLFSKIIESTTTMGFGVSEETVKQFNDHLDKPIVDKKNNQIIGLKFLNVSTDGNEGFVIADLGEEFNSPKKGEGKLYQKLYDAFKKAND